MKTALAMVLAGAFAGFCLPATADDGVALAFGGDQYSAGQHATIAAPVAHDAFLAGYDVGLTAPVSGDAHVGGFNVNAGSDIAGDLYAAGFSINVTGTVGGDLTATGNSVSLHSGAPVAGNARLAGAAVNVGSPITGSALISATTLTLGAPITGDLKFYGESIVFADGARVDGILSIQAPHEIAVPASVASADRVTYQVLAAPDYVSEAGKTAENVARSFWPALWTAAIWWLLLLVIGAVFIALMPRGVAAMQVISEKRPFRNIGLGTLAFASVLGLVPVFALTVVGILALPFVLLFAFVACSLAYLAGTYFAGLRIARAFMPVDTSAQRLGMLAVTLIAAALLGMIPFLGWLLTLTLVAFGFGIMAMVLMVRWSRPEGARLQAATAPPGARASSP